MRGVGVIFKQSFINDFYRSFYLPVYVYISNVVNKTRKKIRMHSFILTNSFFYRRRDNTCEENEYIHLKNHFHSIYFVSSYSVVIVAPIGTTRLQNIYGELDLS